MSWSKDDIDTLHACIKDGLSAAQAGKRLGRSRNATLGKAFRLGLSFGKQGGTEGSKARSKGPGKRPNSTKRQAIHDPVRSAPIVSTSVLETADGVLPATDLDPATDPRYSPRPLLDLERDQCKFPLWSDGDPVHLCCGARRDATDVYCEAHKAVAYNGSYNPADTKALATARRMAARRWR